MPDAPLKLMLWHWGRRGGGPRYTMELARALAGRENVELHLSLSRQSELFAETDAVGVPSWHVSTYSSMPEFVVRSALLPMFRSQLIAYLRKHRIDVVYNTMDFLWGSVLAPAVAKSGSLYLLAVHDAERHPGDDGRIRDYLLRRDIEAADGAVTMTDAVREQLLAVHGFPAERAWTAPLGVFVDAPVSDPRTLPTDRPIRLLFFGRVLEYKGLDIGLAALPLIRKERPDIEFEIWASGDIAPYREALDATEGVRLKHGWIAEDDIPGIFERTDICVLPYREASQSAVVATALAAGMPVVTTPVPGPVEQIGNGEAGRVCDDISPESFARAVLDVVNDPGAYAGMSKRAIALSQGDLSWPSIAGRIEAAARELVALGPRRTRTKEAAA